MNTNERYKVWKQNQYDYFKQCERVVRTTGMIADPVFKKRLGGYIVSVRPTLFARTQIASFARDLASRFDGLFPYDESMLGVTISVYGVTKMFDPHEENSLNETLSSFEEVIKCAHMYNPYEVMSQFNSGSVIGLSEIILVGDTQTDTFFNLVTDCIKKASLVGINLSFPLSPHITYARATKSISSDKVARISEMCKEFTFKSHPLFDFSSVSVGYFTADTNKLSLSFQREVDWLKR